MESGLGPTMTSAGPIRLRRSTSARSSRACVVCGCEAGWGHDYLSGADCAIDRTSLRAVWAAMLVAALLCGAIYLTRFYRVVRAHWGVENRLHWVLDVVFREDLARFRTGDGPQNMAIIRHTALNLLSGAKPTVSLKNRRKRAGWNVDYLETVIRQTA